MATSDGVDRMVGRLVNTWPKMAETLTGGTMDEWTNALRHVTDDQLHDAISEVICAERFAPPISVVVAACRTIVANDHEVRDARRDDAKARDLRHAWDDYDVRRRAGQRGIMSPSGDIS